MSHQMAYLWCRLDIDVQLVTKQLGGFDDVRVRAALFRLDEGHPNGCSEVLSAVEVEVKDKDHWISLDANTKRSHKEAGIGGLALVQARRKYIVELRNVHTKACTCIPFVLPAASTCFQMSIGGPLDFPGHEYLTLTCRDWQRRLSTDAGFTQIQLESSSVDLHTHACKVYLHTKASLLVTDARPLILILWCACRLRLTWQLQHICLPSGALRSQISMCWCCQWSRQTGSIWTVSLYR